ncbi:MAG: fibronectin type III domain-containing protein, partial [Candidatus Omnitrophica bacterium]|nr:fibronectin type III domain-containing protein [Candidatus Omnitrophota bacterium]
MKKHLLNSKRGLAFIISVILLSPFSFTYNTLADSSGVPLGQTAMPAQLVYITTPKEGEFLHTLPNNKVNIVGSAYLEEGFKEYQLFYAPKNRPTEIKKIIERPATTMIRDSSLCFWDTAGLEDGEYVLILKVKVTKDQKNIELADFKNITIDNKSEAPEFINLHGHGTAIGRPLRFKVEARDPDDPSTAQGKVVISCLGAERIPGFNFNPLTRIVSWSPNMKDKGKTYKVVFIVTDDQHRVEKEVLFSVVDIKEEKLPTLAQQGLPFSALIWGDNVVWSQTGRQAGIYKYDLLTGEKNKIIPFHYLDDFNRDKLIWINRNQLGRGDIFVYDLSTGLVKRIDTASRAFSARISDGKIAWDDGVSLNLVDLNDPSLNKRIKIASGNVYGFSIDKKGVVFDNIDQFGNSSGIYFYNLANQKKNRISNYHCDSPQISNDKVAWLDFSHSLRNNRTDLDLYDLSTGKEKRIAMDIGNSVGIDIDRDKVTWSSDKKGRSGIYLYDLAKDMEVKVANYSFLNLNDHSQPKISSNRIVWADKHNVYLEKVTFPPIIVEINPKTSTPEGTLTIKGKDFGDQQDVSQVQFENKAVCPIDSWTDTEITCKVPAEAVSGEVRVINAAGESNGIKVSLEALVLPPAPLNLTAINITARQVDLAWGYDFKKPNAQKINNFIIRRKDLTQASDAGYITVDKNVAKNATTFSDKTVSPDTEYNYRVYSTADGELYTECRSEAVHLKTPGTQELPAPTNLKASAISSSLINLHWDSGLRNVSPQAGLRVIALSPQITGFKIERRTEKSDFKVIGTVNNNVTAFNDNQAKSSTMYYYRVRAYNQTIESANSNTAQTLTPQGIPAGPTALGASVNSPNQVSLTWVDNSEDEDGFKIERRSEDGEFSQIDIVGPNIMDYINSGLASDTKYYFRVRAFNNLGDSEYSNISSVITSTSVPNAPSALTALASSPTQIDLNWKDNSHNEVGFMIERRMEGTDFAVIYIVNADQNSYSDMGLSPLIKFYYRVRAYNTAGQSEYSNIADATTPQSLPAAPTALGAYAISANEIGITWIDNSNNEEGFKIERRTQDTEFTQIDTIGANSTNYNSKNLIPNTQYYFRVRAFNKVGNSEYSNVDSTSTYTGIPNAPSELSALATSSSQIDLNWKDNSHNEVGFILERHLEGMDFAVITILNADTTTYRDIGISPNTKFYYRIRAYNTAGQSEYSNIADATTPQSLPIAPTALGVSISSAIQIRITWVDNSNNEAGFRIERSLKPDTDFSQIATVGANTNIFDDTGINLDNTYYYRVCAYNSAGNSEYTNIGTAPLNPGIPTQPSGLAAAVVSSSQINLSWQDNSDNETGFKIERHIEGAEFIEVRIVNAAVTNYSDTQLDEKTKYYYRVRAFNLVGNSGYSNIAQATTSLAVPGAPTALAAVTASANEIRLYWVRNSTNEDGFKIERSLKADADFKQVGTVGAGLESFSDGGLGANTTYYYRVFAYNAAGNSVVTNIAHATTSPVLPNVPSDLIAVASSAQEIDLSWKDNSNNETGFKIERHLEGTDFVEIGIVNANVTTYSNTQLSAATKYYYRVRAMNLLGDSDASNIAQATTPQSIPAAPTALAAAVASSTEIKLYWVRNSTNEDGYKIERKLSTDVDFVQIGAVGPGIEEFSNTGLAADTTYYYRVRAYNSAGNSLYTNTASATTITGIPEGPTELSLTVAPLPLIQIELNWKDNSHNENGFKIERRIEGGNFVEIKIVNAGVISYSDKKLLEGTKYYYRVRAFNLVGDSANSNIAEASTPVTLPLAPTGLAAVAFDPTQINLSWKDNANNETGFKIERKTDSTDFSEIRTIEANLTNFEDLGLEGGRKYYYRIRATNSAGDSDYSNIANATTPIPVPAVPQNLSATVISSSQIDLNWEHNGLNLTGFQIIRGLDGVNFPNVFLVNDATVRSYHDHGLSEGTTYYYKICALNSTVTSDYSNRVDATTAVNLPQAPTGLIVANVSASELNLSWVDNSTNETGFRIERRTETSEFAQIHLTAANVTGYLDPGLIENTKYYYRVQAVNAAGNSGYSNVASNTTVMPNTPIDLKAVALSGSEIDLAWLDNSSDESGFVVQRSLVSGSGYEDIANLQPNTQSYHDSNLESNTTYYYIVCAYKNGGDSSYIACSYGAKATTHKVIPEAPSDFKARAVSSSQIELTWKDNATNETGFKLERATDTNEYSVLKILPAD